LVLVFDSQLLDLVFLVDCTASMGTYIASAQKNITSIVEQISKSSGCNVRFALVTYRDHPPQDTSYVSQVHQFTDNLAQMKTYVDTMRASGGGDGPEAVTDGLFDVNNLVYRPDATRICIFIADAPPHGIEPNGDGFPNGFPNGRDPLQIVREMAQKRIVIYSVACVPAINSYKYAKDFMKAVADISDGQCVSLQNAHLLANIITGGAQEEISLSQLEDDIEIEYNNLPSGLSEDDIVNTIYRKLAAKGTKTAQLQVQTLNESEAPNAHVFVNANSLPDAKAALARGNNPPKKSNTSTSSKPEAVGVATDVITEQQVRRLLNRVRNKKRN